MTGENDNKQNEGTGFAGLSSLVSDVSTTPPLAPKKEPAAITQRIELPDLEVAQHLAPKEPQKPSSGSSAGKWIWGVIVTIVGAGWLINQSIQSTTSPAPSYSSSAQNTVPSSSPPSKQTVSAASPVYGYVTVEKANLRSEADLNSAVLGQLTKMSRVEVIGQSGSWTKVKATGTLPVEGYVASRLLHVGSYQGANRIICDVAGSSRPYSGEVLHQTERGKHSISVSAGSSDTLVKMRSRGKTMLAFYVRAYEKGVVSSVPNGTYEIMFASGRDFSRKCLEFVTDMSVIKDPKLSTFQVTSDAYYEYFQTAEYSLVSQRGGNMNPQTVPADSFRE